MYTCIVSGRQTNLLKKIRVMENVTIHQSKGSETVVGSMPVNELSEKTKEAVENGYVHGFYYDENGDLVYDDIWGETHLAK